MFVANRITMWLWHSGGITMVQKSKIVRLAEEKVNFVDYFNTYVTGEVTIGNHRQYVQAIKMGGSTICPLHAETDASFKIFQKNGLTLFHCFGCNTGGTVVDLFRRIESEKRGSNLSKDEAAASLLKLYGYEEDVADVIKDIDPLQEALNKVNNYKNVTINKTFNFGLFRKQNDKILKSGGTETSKIKQYGEIDRMISAYVLINSEVDSAVS